MPTRPTIIAFIVAVIGIVAVYIVESTDRIDSSIEGARHRVLAADRLPVEKVHTITLQRGEQTPLTFQLRGSRWWQTQPFEYPMDPFSMRQLIVQAAELEYVSTIKPTSSGNNGDSLAALSLHPPNAVITYQWDGRSIGFELGRRGIAGRAYVRVAGERDVYVVDQGLHDRAVDMDPKEWRDRSIFRDVSVDATRVERRNGEEQVIVERDKKQWRMLQPTPTRAAKPAMEEFLEACARAQVGGYILDQPTDLSRFGLDQPIAEVAISTERAVDDNGSVRTEINTQKLLIGSPIGLGSDDRFGKIEGLDTVVRLKAAVLAALLPAPRALVDPTGTGVQPSDVKQITILTPASDLKLERDLERWIAPDLGGVEVEYAIVDSLLKQICTVAAPTVEFRPYPRDLEAATITLYGYNHMPIDTVRVARDPETQRWALENGDNVLRIFPASMIMPLTPADFGLKSK